MRRRSTQEFQVEAYSTSPTGRLGFCQHCGSRVEWVSHSLRLFLGRKVLCWQKDAAISRKSSVARSFALAESTISNAAADNSWGDLGVALMQWHAVQSGCVDDVCMSTSCFVQALVNKWWIKAKRHTLAVIFIDERPCSDRECLRTPISVENTELCTPVRKLWRKMCHSSSSPCKSPLEDGLGAAAPTVDGDSGFAREKMFEMKYFPNLRSNIHSWK